MNGKEMQRFLRNAVKAHAKPGHRVWAGMNFVECSDCKKHAHIVFSDEPPTLLVHNGNYSIQETIAPEQF